MSPTIYSGAERADDQQRARERWGADVMRTIQQLHTMTIRMAAVAQQVVERDASPTTFARLCGAASELLCQLAARAVTVEEYR